MAGNFATPAKAMPSSSTSSSGSHLPLALHQLEECLVGVQGLISGRPITRSVSTEVDAWLIEQPSAAYETSETCQPRSSVVQVHPQRHLVTAGRVDVVHLGLERLPQARVVRVAVVIEDDLLVERVEVHGCVITRP